MAVRPGKGRIFRGTTFTSAGTDRCPAISLASNGAARVTATQNRRLPCSFTIQVQKLPSTLRRQGRLPARIVSGYPSHTRSSHLCWSEAVYSSSSSPFMNFVYLFMIKIIILFVKRFLSCQPCRTVLSLLFPRPATPCTHPPIPGCPKPVPVPEWSGAPRCWRCRRPGTPHRTV